MKELLQIVNEFENILKKFPEVRYVGDPILRQIAEIVSVNEAVVIYKKLFEILLRYRKETGYGRGFAAPQIGINKAVFVTFVNDQLEVFINPKIIEKSKTTNYYRELCLSSGIMSADVARSKWIVMEWTDEHNVKHKSKFEGFLARLYQHEEAHLQGKVNLDDSVEGGIEFALFNPLDEQLRTKLNFAS